MTIYLNNGNQFTPNKNELLIILLYLKGVFTPNMFNLFEADYNKREVLVESFEKPYLYMDILSENKNYPDFNFLESNVDNLSFTNCAQYMMFFLRLAKRQGGGDAFVSMWKYGLIERLVVRMLDTFDSCMLE